MTNCLSEKWMIVSDIHFGPTTLIPLKNSCDWFVDQVKQVRPRYVFNLGDTLHCGAKIDPVSQGHAYDFLNRVIQYKDDTQGPFLHMLIGNHDMKDKTSMINHAFTPLEILMNKRKGSPIYVYSEIVYIPELKVLMCPFSRDQTEIRKWIETNIPSPQDRMGIIVMGHFALSGAIMSGYSQATTIKCHDDNNIPDAKNKTITIAFFKQFKITFSGHFHHHQIFVHEQKTNLGKTVYVGSLQENRFGEDSAVQKGYILYTPSTNQFELIKNPYAHLFVQYSSIRDVIGMMSNPITNYDDLKNKSIKIHHDFNILPDEMKQCKEFLLSKHVKSCHFQLDVNVNNTNSTTTNSTQLLHLGNNNIESYILDQAHKYLTSLRINEIDSYISVFQGIITDNLSNHNNNNNDHDMSVASTGKTNFQIALLTMTNFCGIPFTVSYSLISERGVYVLEGNNGSGKSILLDAIVWCLYNHTIRECEVSQLATDVNSTITVELTLTNGTKIIRQRYKSAVTISVNHQFVTNETVLSQFELPSLATFRATMMLSAPSAKKEMILLPSERKKMMEKAMGLEILQTYDELLKNEFKKNNEILKDLNSKQEILQSKQNVNQKISSENLETLQQELSRSQDLFEANKNKILALEANHRIEEKSIAQTKLDLEKKQKQLKDDQERQRKPILTKINKWNNTLNDLNTDLKSNQLQVEKEKQSKRNLSSDPLLDSIKHQVDTHIKKVLIPLSQEHEKIKDTLPTKYNKYFQQTFDFMTNQLSQKLDNGMQKQLDVIDSNILELKNTISDIVSKIDALTNQINEMEENLNTMDENPKHAEQLNEIENQLFQLSLTSNKSQNEIAFMKKQLVQDEKSVSYWQNKISNYCRVQEVQQQDYRQESANYQSQISELNVKQQIVLFWINSFHESSVNSDPSKGAFRQLMRSYFVQQLNLRLNDVIRQLSPPHSRQIFVEYEDDFTLVVRNQVVKKNKSGSGSDLKILSRGETGKVDMATFLIIFQSMCSARSLQPNILFLDECFTGQDEESMIQFCRYLKTSFLEQCPWLHNLILLNPYILSDDCRKELTGMINVLSNQECPLFHADNTTNNSTKKRAPKKLKLLHENHTSWQKYILR